MQRASGLKFFRLVSDGVDVAPLNVEVRHNEYAWLLNTSRQEKIAVQRETNTIFLRSAVVRADLHVNENQESRATEVSRRFPLALEFMTKVANSLNSDLARATIVRLAPRGVVQAHIDVGSYYLIRNRFHLVLESPSGSMLASGDEQVRMQVGQLWWFDNKQHHMAANESDQWRVHYIFDLLPKHLRPLAKNPLPLEVIETMGGGRLDHHHA